MFVDPKGKAPVLAHDEAPNTSPVPGKAVRLPMRHVGQFVLALHILKERDDCPDLHGILPGQSRGIVLQDEPLQPLVPDAADQHGEMIMQALQAVKCRASLYE